MKYLIAASLALLFSVPALADITATYKVRDGGDMQISYRDDQHVRLNVPGGGYALLTGEKVYMVSQEMGQWVATDLEQMKAMMANMPMGGSNKAVDKSETDFSFVDTGKKETIAGYTGTVYQIKDRTNGKTYEAVLSDHKDIATLYRGMLQVATQMVSNMGMGKGMPELPSGRGGLLRQDNQFVLTGVDKADQGAGYYELPKGVKMRDLSQAAQSMKSMPMPSAQDMQNMDPRARAMMEKMMQNMQQGQ